MKTLIALVLTIALLLTSVPMYVLGADEETDSVVGWDGSIAAGFESGNGTAQDPFVIMNGAQLAYFASEVNSGNDFSEMYLTLGADILLNDTSDWEQWGSTDADGFLVAPANVWSPIGDRQARRFCGDFDGGGYTIRGLYVRSSASVIGLFGNTNGANLSNIRLEQSAVIGFGGNYPHVGGICGYANKTVVSNCENGAFVSGATDYAAVGGVCGSLNQGTVKDCENRGRLEGSGFYTDVGGVVGSVSDATVSGCRNAGTVCGDSTRIDVGGVCGYVSEGTVSACVNNGAVSSEGTYSNAGGVVGNISAATVKTSDNRGTVDGGSEAYVGGVCGYADSEATVHACRNSGALCGASLMGGAVGAASGRVLIKECYSSGSLTNSGSYNEVGGVVGELYNESTVAMCYAAGVMQSTTDNLTGGLVGEVWSDCTVENSYYLDTLPSTNACGSALSDAQMRQQESFADWNFRSVWELGFEDGYAYPTLRAFGSKEFRYRVVLKDGDTVLSARDYAPGEAADLTPPARSAYDFAYWRTEDLRQISAAEMFAVEEDVTLTAVWMPKRTTQTSWDGSVDTSWEGNGTAASPYLIATPAELAGVAVRCAEAHGWDANTYFTLTADIVLNDGGAAFSDTVVGRFAWTPIGEGYTQFRANFDGNGHTVSGLYLFGEGENVGLFGNAREATIRRLTLAASYVRGKRNVGGIVGSAGYGTLEDCVADAQVCGGNYVGGVCGSASETNVLKCENRGTVSGDSNIGGICGDLYSSTIADSINKGQVSGNSQSGGVVGYAYDSTVTACRNDGVVNGKNYVGGIAGRAEVVRCANHGIVRGEEYVGGVVGYGAATESYSAASVQGTRFVGGVLGYGDATRCYNAGEVTGEEDYGPLVYSGSSDDSYYLDTVCRTNGYGTSLTADQLALKQSFTSWNFLSVWELGFDKTYAYPTLRDLGSRVYSYRVVLKDGERILSETIYDKGERIDLTPPANDEYDFGGWRDEAQRTVEADAVVPACEDLVLTAVWAVKRTSAASWDGSVDTVWDGSGTADDPYLIGTPAELAGLAATVVSYHSWQSKWFSLTADIVLNDGGEQFSEWVSGKHAWNPIGGQGRQFCGHFDGNGHTISGLYIHSDGKYVGLFGMASHGSIADLTVEKSYVRGERYVGGVCGYTYSEIFGCTNNADVFGTQDVGGVVGYGEYVASCINRGNVRGEENVGGVCASGTVSLSKNFGSVTAKDYVGGVCAFSYDTVSDCTNEGPVVGKEYVGGIVGGIHGDVTNGCNFGSVYGESMVGGLVGTTHAAIVNGCNNATVKGSRTTGGIVGCSYDEVLNCYNVGTVNGEQQVGGICGVGNATACYNIGEVNGKEYVSAVTSTYDTATACYYLEGSAKGEQNGTVLTAAQMTEAASFVGFDFENCWTIDSTAAYPYPTLTGLPHRVFLTVTYKDSDGTVLMTERVEQGGCPSYAAPYTVLLEDENYVYRFENWDSDTREVNGDLTITAVRSKIEKQVIEPLCLTMTAEYGYSAENLRVDLESLWRRVICTTATGYRVMSEVAWDARGYDPTVSGTYTLEGVLSLLESPYYKAAQTPAVTLAVTVAPQDATEHVFRAEELLFKEQADGTLAVVGYEGDAERVVIPASWNGKAVSTIADGAFQNNRTLLSVTLPVSLCSIGARAFAGCSSLREAALPEGLQTVGERAFYDTALTSITCAAALTTIGEKAFGFGGESPAAVEQFVVCGYADSAASRYAQAHGFGYVTTVRVSDAATAIQATVPEHVTLVVSEVTDGESFDNASKILENTDGVKVYDLTVYNTQGEAVQPDGMITFVIPLPETFDSADCHIYRVNEDGSYKNMNAQLLDGALVFQTSHLSYYAVIDAGEEILLGDIDEDGAVNTLDVLALFDAVSGRIPFTPNGLAAADVDADGEINTLDVVALFEIVSGQK